MQLNKQQKAARAFTHEGAAAPSNPFEQLQRSVLSCLLWEDTFYEEGEDIAARISRLVAACDPLQVSRLALVARAEANLRHVPLLMVNAMSEGSPAHKALVRETLRSVIQRPDELTEFLAIYWKKGKHPLAAGVKKGLADAFLKFNEYSLAKYNRDGAIRLRDALFLSHAKADSLERERTFKRLIGGFCTNCWDRITGATERPRNLLSHKLAQASPRVMKGRPCFCGNQVEAKLPTPDTWEVALSEAHTPQAKREVWTRLLVENKLGALALIRNLRNMEQVGVQGPLIREMLSRADITRVLPYRFIAAAKAAPQFEPDLEALMFRAAVAARKMPGDTVLLIDVSPSMEYALSGGQHNNWKTQSDPLSRMDAACALAMLAREQCERVRVFSFSSNVVEVAPRRGFALRDAIITSQQHNGTLLRGAVARLAAERQVGRLTFNRLIVFTDEESQDGVPVAPQGVASYLMNVAPYRNGVSYANGWRRVDGFSSALLDYIIRAEDTFRD